MATIVTMVRDLADPKQITTEIDVVGPLVEFLTPLSDDNLSVMKGVIPPGVSVPLHSHADAEAFYVVAGEVQLFSGKATRWTAARAGQFAYIPGHEKHAWRNTSGKEVTMLVISTATIAKFFQEIGITISKNAPPPPPSPQRLQHLAETALKYGHWLGSPEENAAIGITF